MADHRVPGIDEPREPGRNRVQRLLDQLVRRDEQPSSFQQLAGATQQLNRLEADKWSLAGIGDLVKRVREALDEAARGEAARSADNPYAQQQAIENVRASMRQIVLTLQPPGAMIASAEFQ